MVVVCAQANIDGYQELKVYDKICHSLVWGTLFTNIVISIYEIISCQNTAWPTCPSDALLFLILSQSFLTNVFPRLFCKICRDWKCGELQQEVQGQLCPNGNIFLGSSSCCCRLSWWRRCTNWSAVGSLSASHITQEICKENCTVFSPLDP